MINRPSVTIIIICRNSISTVRKCIERSLCDSSGAVETICIDRGSTDGTLSVLKEFAVRREELRVIACSEISFGEAMLVGSRFARSDYCCFVDARDYVTAQDCEFVFTQGVSFCEPDMIVAGTVGFVDGESQDYIVEDPFWNGFFSQEEKDCLLEHRPLRLGCYHGSCLVKTDYVLRQSDIIECGNGDILRGELLWVRLAMACDNVEFVPRNLYKMRMVKDCNLEVEYYRNILNSRISSNWATREFDDSNMCMGFLSALIMSCVEVDPRCRQDYIERVAETIRNLEKEQDRLFLLTFPPPLSRVFEAISGSCTEYYYRYWHNRDEILSLHCSLGDNSFRLKQSLREMETLNRSNAELRAKIAKLKQSNSYRIGRACTVVPRAAKRALRRIMQ